VAANCEQADISLPAQPTGKDAAEGQKLRGVTGTTFDQAYAQGQLQDHRETVELFQKEASSGQDPSVESVRAEDAADSAAALADGRGSQPEAVSVDRRSSHKPGNRHRSSRAI
jgi:predicted outer membrane protein